MDLMMERMEKITEAMGMEGRQATLYTEVNHLAMVKLGETNFLNFVIDCFTCRFAYILPFLQCFAKYNYWFVQKSVAK